jgi:2-phosphoglycerate kinase
MIYLIGGSIRSGKTTTARLLAKKLGIAWIQTDSLRYVVRAHCPKKEIYKKFPFKKMDALAGNLIFDKYTAKEFATAEITESKTIWPGLLAFINHVYKTREDCVIEGVHLLPSLVHKIKNDPIFKELRIVYLVKKDLDNIIDGLRKNNTRHDWLADIIKTQSGLTGAAKAVREEGLYFEKEAKKFGFDIILTESNFKSQINKAVKYLMLK